jgi:acyl-[acyl-carrier-protein]-phospholipid O-acyltransferase/long-chain-fatty-acid--[acyl-carrier-protein] ligase
VGRAFPRIEVKLEPVEGMERGGRLLVKGPNVMLGYIKADRPGVIQLADAWYDTGDIVELDADGFITILGRAKRFAKIGGEMVSLASAEEFAAALSPGKAHAALAVPDTRKGEQIVLLSEDGTLTRERLIAEARAHGVSELALPRAVRHVPELPRLGSGKVDYVRLKELL